jgi:hypothetical protein
MSDEAQKRVYHFDEGVISIPRGFVDRSTQTLEWPVDNSSSLTLVVQRQRLAWGSFDDLVDRETREYPARYLGFKAEETEYPDPFGGSMPIRHVAFRWKAELDVLYNHQAFVYSAPLVLVFIVSAKALHRERADQLMKEALSGLRFREE